MPSFQILRLALLLGQVFSPGQNRAGSVDSGSQLGKAASWGFYRVRSVMVIHICNVTLELWRLRQEGVRFRASLGYKVRPYFQNK